MRVGIVGAGNVGTGIARHLVAKGHEVAISFSREPDKLAMAAAATGARTATPEQAVIEAEVVVLATPWAATLDIVGRLVPLLNGTIIWDTTNPLLPDMSGLAVGTTNSGGEMVAAVCPGARIVKAVPPFADLLTGPNALAAHIRPGVFVCGDDRDARRAVTRLVSDIGADPVEAGPLRNARYTEPLGMLLVQLAYVEGLGTGIGVRLLRSEPA